jgi:hypothetical protein
MASIELYGVAPAYSYEPTPGAPDSQKAAAPAGDSVQISPEARKKLEGSDSGKADSPGSLTAEEQRMVDKLKQRDQEVHAHEQAHVMAGGSLVRGGPQFQYRTGPDGQQYAIGGEVSIDTSPVSGDPRATIRKAQQVHRAALAPAQPSGQDQAVAAQASTMEMNALSELFKSTRSAGKVDTKA